MADAKIFKIGLAFLLVGPLMIGAYSSGIIGVPAVFTIGVICVLLGVVVLGAAIVIIVLREYMPKEGISAGDHVVFSTALLRCMLAISIADDVLDDEEVTELQKIYKHVTHADIDEKAIRDTAKEMLESHTNIESELSHLVHSLNKENKKKLIIASLHILAADGDMDHRELIMLDDIREGLQLSLAQVEKIKADFFAGRNLREV